MNLAALVLICSNLSVFVCVWIPHPGAVFQCWLNKCIICYVSYVMCTSVLFPPQEPECSVGFGIDIVYVC